MSPSQFSKTLDTYLDFHRTYLFRVMFFDGLIGAVQGTFITNLISATDTPTSTTSAINLPWMGTKAKIVGKTDFPDWKVTVRDDAISAAYSYFQDWRDKVYNVTSGKSARVDNTGIAELVGVKPGYKKSAIVIMFGNKITTQQSVVVGKRIENTKFGEALGAAASVRAYLINGIWPKDMGAITLDYSTESIATFPVNFSVDSFEPYSITGAAASAVSSLVG